MEKELFALLQLGLGLSEVGEDNLSNFIMLSASKWTHIINLARKQGVLGIVLDGVEQLEHLPIGATKGLPMSLKLELIGEVLQIEQRNQHQREVMKDLAEKWTQRGCHVMVMKGQTNGTFYPKPEHRSPGDIDCYLFENYAIGNDIARLAGAKVDESWYKHSVINYKGETFENHQFFVHTRDGKRGKRLERELEDTLKVDTSFFLSLTSAIMMPPAQWNAMFLTYHACAHFISEGLRLKQIVDWAMFLKLHQKDIDWYEFYFFCERFHLKRFADAMTAIAVKYLGIKMKTAGVVCESPYADVILRNSLYEEDYVFGSGKSNWYNRFHLIRNMFHYRWKYEDRD